MADPYPFVIPAEAGIFLITIDVCLAMAMPGLYIIFFLKKRVHWLSY